MKCDYCFDSFDLDTKLPIKLSCSHSYCKECIEILKNILTYCPIDNHKVDYSLGEANQEVLNELKFDCPQHNSHCIGVCFDHCFPLCEDCIESHSECKIFKGTPKMIANKMVELVDLASKNKAILIKNESNPSIFNLNEVVDSVESHLKTLDSLFHKFEKNLLSQDEKEKFIKNIQLITKIKENSKELLSAEDNGLALKNPIFNLNDLDYKHFMKNIFKNLNRTDERVGLEKKFVDSNVLTFFRQITTNTEEYGKYFCNFRHTYANFILVNGCGFGTPSKEGGSIFISCFEISVNDENYSEEIGIIDFIPDRLTSKIQFKNSIIFPRDTDLFFHIEIEGTSNFLFEALEYDRVSVNDLDGKLYNGKFPILHLLIII